MSDEIKVTTEQNENKCFCQNKSFRKFLVITAGTFTGVFLALSLFAALHKPPVFIGPQFMPMRGCPCQMMHHRHHIQAFREHGKRDFGKLPQKFDKKFMGDKRQTPFEAKRPEVDD